MEAELVREARLPRGQRPVHLARDKFERPLVAWCGFVAEPGADPLPQSTEVTCVVCRDLVYGDSFQ